MCCVYLRVFPPAGVFPAAATVARPMSSSSSPPASSPPSALAGSRRVTAGRPIQFLVPVQAVGTSAPAAPLFSAIAPVAPPRSPPPSPPSSLPIPRAAKAAVLFPFGSKERQKEVEAGVELTEGEKELRKRERAVQREVDNEQANLAKRRARHAAKKEEREAEDRRQRNARRQQGLPVPPPRSHQRRDGRIVQFFSLSARYQQ